MLCPLVSHFVSQIFCPKFRVPNFVSQALCPRFGVPSRANVSQRAVSQRAPSNPNVSLRCCVPLCPVVSSCLPFCVPNFLSQISCPKLHVPDFVSLILCPVMSQRAVSQRVPSNPNVSLRCCVPLCHVVSHFPPLSPILCPKLCVPNCLSQICRVQKIRVPSCPNVLYPNLFPPVPKIMCRVSHFIPSCPIFPFVSHRVPTCPNVLCPNVSPSSNPQVRCYVPLSPILCAKFCVPTFLFQTSCPKLCVPNFVPQILCPKFCRVPKCPNVSRRVPTCCIPTCSFRFLR